MKSDALFEKIKALIQDEYEDDFERFVKHLKKTVGNDYKNLIKEFVDDKDIICSQYKCRGINVMVTKKLPYIKIILPITDKTFLASDYEEACNWILEETFDFYGKLYKAGIM